MVVEPPRVREPYFKVIEHTRMGVFGLKHHWTYLLIDGQGKERRLHSTGEALDALTSRHGRQDAYLWCIEPRIFLVRGGRGGSDFPQELSSWTRSSRIDAAMYRAGGSAVQADGRSPHG